MGVTENIEAIRKLEDAYNSQDYDAVRSLLATEFTPHTPGSEMLPPGVDGALAAAQGAYQSFPDKRTEIIDIFGEGDRVVTHVRMTGTNTGGIPWAGVPANDKAVDIDWIQISRHADDGSLLETWSQMDTPKMMVQLGVMPAPEGM
jgi:predicted ester cyclase